MADYDDYNEPFNGAPVVAATSTTGLIELKAWCNRYIAIMRADREFRLEVFKLLLDAAGKMAPSEMATIRATQPLNAKEVLK